MAQIIPAVLVCVLGIGIVFYFSDISDFISNTYPEKMEQKVLPPEFLGPRESSDGKQKGESYEKTADNVLETKTFGFRVSYPEGWIAQKDISPQAAALFFSPREGPEDDFGENVLIYVTDLSATSGSSLKTLTDSVLDGQIERFGADITILSRELSTLSGYPAERVSYRRANAIHNTITGRALATVAIKDNKGYIITYVAKEDTYDKFLEDAKMIIRSFEFL